MSEFAEGQLVCPAYSRTWLHGTISRHSYPGALGMAVDRGPGTVPHSAEAVVRAPSHLEAREAATLPCAAVTAWNALVEQVAEALAALPAGRHFDKLVCDF